MTKLEEFTFRPKSIDYKANTVQGQRFNEETKEWEDCELKEVFPPSIHKALNPE